MWEEAISAIKNSDEKWLRNNHQEFKVFFESENILPLGKLSENALHYHYKHRLFKIFVSEKYNGLALDFLSASKWIENASYLDGNWGWLLAIGVGGAYFIDFLPHKIAHHYFSPQDALVAGSGKPDGEAIKKDEKYLVNGKWSFCSGAEQASLFTATTTRNHNLTAVILPKEQVEICRDWDMIGLPLTCSHTIIAKDLNVNEDHFFSLQNVVQDSNYSLSKVSFFGFATICFVPVVVGISKSFWSLVEEILLEKRNIWQEYHPNRYLYIQNACENFKQMLSILKNKYQESISLAVDELNLGKEVNTQSIEKNGLQLAEFCKKSCDEIFPKLGMNVLKKTHPIQQNYQNLQTAYQHIIFHHY